MKKMLFVLLISLLLGAQTGFAEEKLGCGVPARVFTFEELTGLSREDLDHIDIRSGMGCLGYSTAYDKDLSAIYDAINTKGFYVDMPDGNRGGWRYEILFFDKNHQVFEYTISTGMVVKNKDGLTYRTSNEEELLKVVEEVYGKISDNRSNGLQSFAARTKDFGFFDKLIFHLKSRSPGKS